MLGRTHELGGITSVLVADVIKGGVVINTPTAITCIFASLVGALTPDLDKPTSLIYSKIPAGSLIGKIVHPVFIGGHRHLSHSLLGFLLFAWGSHWLIFKYLHIPGLNNTYIWYAYVIGIISHLILDSVTTEGIPLFFPLPYKFGIPPVSFLRITTGGIIEKFIVFPLFIIAIGYIYLHYYYIFTK